MKEIIIATLVVMALLELGYLVCHYILVFTGCIY